MTGAHTRGQMVLDRRRNIIYSEDFKPNIVCVDRVDIDLFKKYLLQSVGH